MACVIRQSSHQVGCAVEFIDLFTKISEFACPPAFRVGTGLSERDFGFYGGGDGLHDVSCLLEFFLRDEWDWGQGG
jgi:uncharacterized membrane protein YadS